MACGQRGARLMKGWCGVRGDVKIRPVRLADGPAPELARGFSVPRAASIVSRGSVPVKAPNEYGELLATQVGIVRRLYDWAMLRRDWGTALQLQTHYAALEFVRRRYLLDQATCHGVLGASIREMQRRIALIAAELESGAADE